MLLALPLVYAIVLKKKRDYLLVTSVRDRIGSLYLGKKETETSAIAFVIIYLLRRILFVVLAIVLATQPHILVHMVMLSNLFYMMYLGFSMPFLLEMHWRVELANEFLLLTQYYYFVLYAGLVPTDRTTRDKIGIAHVIHIGVLFLLNLVVISVVNVTSVYRALYLKKLAYA